MTAVDASAATRSVTPRGTGVAVLRLARAEGRRVVLHPAFLALLGMFAVVGVNGVLLGEALDRYYLPLVFFAANLIASSARRSGTEELLAAAPVSGQARTAAVCLAVLAPTVLAGVAAAALYTVTYGGTDLEKALTIAELLAVPACALGGGLLGVAVARWLPWPGAPLAVMVALVAWSGAAQEKANWIWTSPWTTAHGWLDHPAVLDGSQAWHAVYLAGLAMSAGFAALLRHRSHRAALLATSALVAAATLAAAILQLP